MAAHLDDVESDLSAIHHIPDPGPLPAGRVYALAERLAYYQGVVRAKVLAEQRENAPIVPPGTEWVSPEQMLAMLAQPQ